MSMCIDQDGRVGGQREGIFSCSLGGKTHSLMVDHGSVRHSPNLEGACGTCTSLSLSLSKKKMYVLCCAVKISTWVGTHLATLIPNRPGRGNLIWCRCTELEFVGYTPFRHAEVFVGVRYRTHVLRSCHQYVTLPT